MALGRIGFWSGWQQQRTQDPEAASDWYLPLAGRGTLGASHLVPLSLNSTATEQGQRHDLLPCEEETMPVPPSFL